jgi:hypothetical protein
MNTVMKLRVLKKVQNFFTSMREPIGYAVRVGEAVLRQTPHKMTNSRILIKKHVWAVKSYVIPMRMKKYKVVYGSKSHMLVLDVGTRYR